MSGLNGKVASHGGGLTLFTAVVYPVSRASWNPGVGVQNMASVGGSSSANVLLPCFCEGTTKRASCLACMYMSFHMCYVYMDSHSDVYAVLDLVDRYGELWSRECHLRPPEGGRGGDGGGWVAATPPTAPGAGESRVEAIAELLELVALGGVPDLAVLHPAGDGCHGGGGTGGLLRLDPVLVTGGTAGGRELPLQRVKVKIQLQTLNTGGLHNTFTVQPQTSLKWVFGLAKVRISEGPLYILL